MISIIVAIARDGVIGGGNALLWHISEDLRRFKSITTGHPVVMGRKTYESLGRPLPNRVNVVITRQRDLVAAGCSVVGSLQEALELFVNEQEVFIIGGGEIYTQAMQVADRLYITDVDANYPGDTYFPQWDKSKWTLISSEHYEKGERFDKPFTFNDYERRK